MMQGADQTRNPTEHREDLVENVVEATRGLCCFMDDSQVQEVLAMMQGADQTRNPTEHREDLVETVVDATRGLCCFMNDLLVQEFEKGISAAIKDAYEEGIEECPFAELKRLREENAIIKGQTWQTVQLCDVVKRLSEENVRLEKELSGKKDELARSTFWGKSLKDC